MTASSDHVPTTSPAAVRDATGRDWDAWFAVLDDVGAQRMGHREIVAWLRDEAGLTDGWWQQNVTVEHEKARGTRAIGETADGTFQVGVRFRTEDGVEAEVRVVRPGHRLRLRWRPREWDRPSTLQVTVTPKGERCTVGLHHERLPDAAAREAMRERWRGALDALEATVRERRPSGADAS